MSGETNGFDADGNPVQYRMGGGIDKSFLKPEISNMIKRGEKKEDKGDKMSGELRERIAKIVFRNDYKETSWEDTPQLIKKRFLSEADIIIAFFLEQVEKCVELKECENPIISPMVYVSKDMAIDAGDRSLEGSVYKPNTIESCGNCQVCFQNKIVIDFYEKIKESVK